MTFFGTVYDANGAHPDPKKVDAIHKMPPPDSKLQLQHFLGMVTYLPPFIPSLSTHTAPLRELLKKDSEFMWNPKELFSKHGIPETIRSDNGPQFASHQFAEFAKEWNFDHTTSSPRNPRSNGQAGSSCQGCKRSPHPCQVLRAGSLPCLVGIQEHTH